MPGITQLLLQEIDIHPHLNLEEDDEDDNEDMEWRPQCVIVGLNVRRSRTVVAVAILLAVYLKRTRS
jgi:hypothetical protein